MEPRLEFGLRELPEWIRRTLTADRKTRAARPRPISVERVFRSIRPNVSNAIFVVGAPRSGTTWLGDCVGALPEVSYHYEPVLTKAAARHVFDGEWSYPVAARVFRETYRLLNFVYLDGDLVFSEKTPQNCFIIPFLARTFPSSKFLHVIRDGRDSAASLLKKPWLRADAGGQSGKREPGGYLYGAHARFWVEPERRLEFETTSDARRCAWSWRRHVEAALTAGATLPASRWLELRYESLVDHPREQADRMLDFLGIANQESRAQFQAAVGKRDASRRGSHKTQLKPAELEDVLLEAGGLLERLGYTD